jgi:benzylsuccinate CoA-transferase BbsF subunit
MVSSRLLLAGIRVLDFTQILAGPFCTRLLADLGAEVLKVETATRPDRTSATRPDPDAKGRQDRPPAFLNTNRNKRSITINLKTDSGRDLATRLATIADVVIENFSANVMDRLGLGYERLEPLNPRLVYVSMAGYGHSGPRREWTSMNMNLQAYTGLMMTNGAEGDLPTSISNSWNDYIGGLHATFGILQTLAERRTSGRGAFLDLAQFECSVSTLAPLLVASAASGRAPARTGNRSTRVAPQGNYPCAGKDEWCVISVQDDGQWRALVGVIGGGLGDPRYGTVIGRLRHHDEIDTAIEGWTSQLSKEDVESRLGTVGVSVSRMRRIKEVFEEDGPTAYRRMEDPPGHTMPATGTPFSFAKSAIAPLAPAPALGEHTEQALGEWLGLTPDDMRSLGEHGALV